METLSFALHDQHVHSSFSADSEEDVINYVKIAKEKGCKYFVTTDHCDLNIANTNRDWHADYKKEEELYKTLEEKYNIKMLVGIEYGFKLTEKERIYEVLKEAHFDIVNASVHDYKDIDYYFIKYFKSHGIKETIDQYFDNLIVLATSDWDYDVISHIDYGFKTLYLYDNSYSIKMFEDKLIKVFEGIIKNKKVLEINTKVQEAINDDNHVKYLLKLYKSLGGELISLSSDAHEAKRYLSNFEKYKEIIKECGFDKLCYFVKREMKFYNI